MRIVAGTAKGRKLVAPAGSGTRPVADRAKEALFSALGDTVEGAAVLDLYAGSGSLGLEALSRGAISAVLVERDRSALGSLRRNVANVGLGGEVIAAEVDRYLDAETRRFDMAFVDPPWAVALASLLSTLEKVESRLTAEGIVVVHRRRGDAMPARRGSLVLADRRRYGDAELWRYRREPA